MYDILEIIDNINTVYSNNNSLSILKDYERVLDKLGLYVFEHWDEGELVIGPVVDRHWVTCSFMWPLKRMPNPMGAKRLIDYKCIVTYKEDIIVKPRKIKSPADYRPNSKKGILDEHPVWIVEIQMPKKTILDIFRSYVDEVEESVNPDTNTRAAQVTAQPAEDIAAAPTMPAAQPGAVAPMEPGMPG